MTNTRDILNNAIMLANGVHQRHAWHHTMHKNKAGSIKCLFFVVGAFLVFSLPNAHGLPGEADLVVNDLWLDPLQPQPGDLVSINARLHNASVKPTGSFASFITVGYVVDGKIIKILGMQNIAPGLDGQLVVSSGPMWTASTGQHKVSVIVDYSDTLQDSVDNPKDNEISKIYDIQPKAVTNIIADVAPKYFKTGRDVTVDVKGRLESFVGPIPKQTVTLNIGDITRELITDNNGKFTYVVKKKFREMVPITANFAGDDMYLQSSVTENLYALPKKSDSGMLLKIGDPSGKYDFDKISYDVVVFQNSYESIFKKIHVDKKDTLDSKTMWIYLPSNNYYFEEIYANGRLLAVTDKKYIDDHSVVIQEIANDVASVRFHVQNTENNHIQDAILRNWVYSDVLKPDGTTDWIDVLPTVGKNEPYTPQIVFSDGSVVNTEPFFVSSSERKIVKITIDKTAINDLSPLKGSFDENLEFISSLDVDKVLSYLIEKKIIQSTSDLAQIKQNIPQWSLQNTIKWWIQGNITDRDLILNIQQYVK